jgi:hypothetical protein
VSAARAADGIREVRRLFQAAQNPPRWPMYIRQARQFLRNVDPTFDERKFGFGSLGDLMRACQREGLFRVERDRQGVMRLFAGNVMQPVGEPVLEPQDETPVQYEAPDEQPVATAQTDWTPPAEQVAESEVVEGAVVQELEVPPVVDAEPAAAAEAPRRSRGRGRARQPGESRPARKAGEAGTQPRARKTPPRPRAPRARARTKDAPVE